MVLSIVEQEVQTNVQYYEMQHRDYRIAVTEHWKRLYEMIYELQLAQMRQCVGLFVNAPGNMVGITTKGSVNFVMPLQLTETYHDLLESVLNADEKWSLRHRMFLDLMQSFDSLVADSNILEALKQNCIDGFPSSTAEVIVSCFEELWNNVEVKFKRQLKNLLKSCFQVDVNSGLTVSDVKDFLNKLCQYVFNFAESVAEESTCDGNNLTLLDSSVSTNFVASSQLLRTIIFENCTRIVQNSLVVNCSLALLMMCLDDDQNLSLPAKQNFHKLCDSLHAWNVLKWMCEYEIEHSVFPQKKSADSTKSLINPEYKERSVLADETFHIGHSQLLSHANRSTIATKSRKQTEYNRVTFMSSFINANCDGVLSSVASRTDVNQQKQIVHTVSVKILQMLHMNKLNLAGAVEKVFTHATSDCDFNGSSALIERNPSVVLQLLSGIESAPAFGTNCALVLISYLKLLSCLALESEDTFSVAEAIISETSVQALEPLGKLLSLKSSVATKIHIVSLLEKASMSIECLRLLVMISPQSREDVEMIELCKFRCSLECRNYQECHDSISELALTVDSDSGLVADSLRCWIQEMCNTGNERKLSQMSCMHIYDQVVDILQREMRVNKVDNKFYDCLYSLYAKRKM